MLKIDLNQAAWPDRPPKLWKKAFWFGRIWVLHFNLNNYIIIQDLLSLLQILKIFLKSLLILETFFLIPSVVMTLISEYA